MNFSNHITHWKGKALKTMGRDDLLEVIFDLNAQYHSAKGEIERLRTKAGQSIYN